MDIKKRFKRLISNTQSVKFRYMVSLLSNMISSGIFFFIGIILARTLNPDGYGEYQYLIGLFTSIFAFSDFGSNAAFYTFISQKKRSLKFYLSYMIWQFFQIGIILGIVIFFSESTLKILFVEHNKLLLLMAAGAVFLSTNLRKTINNIAESIRWTFFAQSIALFFNIIHFVAIIVCIYTGFLQIKWIFCIMIIEYLFYYIIGLSTFFGYHDVTVKDDPLSVKDYLNKYLEYCGPLFIYTILSSFILFIDRWLLQKFGGRSEQAFFGVSRQFARISGLATMSLINIYWKEIAEAIKKKNYKRVRMIYLTVSKNLFLLSACISVFLYPYSKHLLLFCYGKKYITAALPFSIMLFYPVQQTLGQIFGSFFLATEKTGTYTKVGITAMLLGLFLSYYLIAPEAYYGLNAGAIGLVWKQIIIQFFGVCILGYIIAKDYDCENLIYYQIKVIILLFGLNYLIFSGLFFINSYIYLKFFLNALLYFPVIGVIIYRNYMEYLRCYNLGIADSRSQS